MPPKKKGKGDAAAKKAAEEAEQRMREEEEARRQAEEDRRRKDEEERLRKQLEDELRKKFEEEERRRKEEEDRRVQEDEERRQREREREVQQLQLFEEKDKEISDLTEKIFVINRNYNAVQEVFVAPMPQCCYDTHGHHNRLAISAISDIFPSLFEPVFPLQTIYPLHLVQQAWGGGLWGR